MLSILIKWLIASLALMVSPYIIPGISLATFWTAPVVIFIFGILSVTVRPILTILTLPINIATLGLFSFIINTLIFWALAFIVEGFEISGFVAAFLGAIFVSGVLFIVDLILD